MKWRLSKAKDVKVSGMSRGEIPDSYLEFVRPGDSLCVVINDRLTMWCKVVLRAVDESSFVCLASYSVPKLRIEAKQKIVIRGTQVVNVLAGINHHKPWTECRYE